MDKAAARRLLAEAKAAGRREEAVAQLREAYLRTKDPGLWRAIGDGFTGPELEGLSAPEATVVGPPHEEEPLLPRRPYRELVWSAFKAPFANASSVFILVVSGPLMLGSMLAIHLAGGLGLLMAMFLGGYVIGFLFDVLSQAAQGHARGPRLLSLVWSDESRFAFVLHFLNWLAAATASFWPVLVLSMALRNSPSLLTWMNVVSFPCLLWFPIALLQVSFGGGFAAFQYAQGAALIRRLGGDYWICAAVFVGTTLLDVGVPMLIGSWTAGVEERVPYATVINWWVITATWFVQMRAAGLLAWARADVR